MYEVIGRFVSTRDVYNTAVNRAVFYDILVTVQTRLYCKLLAASQWF